MVTNSSKCSIFTWNALKVSVSHLSSDECLYKASQILNLEIINIPLSYIDQGTNLHLENRNQKYFLEAKFINKSYSFENINDLLVNLVNLICTCFLNQCEQLVLHSGAFVINNQAVLFSGLPHSGKSTLALNAWLMKYTLINDDLLVYDDKNYHVTPFPKPMKPRLPSTTIPDNIISQAGQENLVVGHFVHDIGLFIGRKSPRMTAYEEEIPVRSFYFIERGEMTKVSLLNRMQALVLVLTQVVPNTSCLKIASLIDYLLEKQALYHLTIGKNDQRKALEIMNA